METREKVDRIWDLVTALAEDEDTTGIISYRKGSRGTGRMIVTLDGRRVTVYIEEAEDGDE